MLGVIAGLVPCPLTLFAMFLALSRGVPEAGLIFAVAMMAGVGATLALVATATVLARQWIVYLMGRHGRSIDSIIPPFGGANRCCPCGNRAPRTLALTRNHGMFRCR